MDKKHSIILLIKYRQKNTTVWKKKNIRYIPQQHRRQFQNEIVELLHRFLFKKHTGHHGVQHLIKL